MQIITLLFKFTLQKLIYRCVSGVHAGSFRVSVIRRTLTWTTGSLTCVRDHSHACVYTRALGTPTTSQHNIFHSGNLSQILLVLLTGLEPRVFGSYSNAPPIEHNVIFFIFVVPSASASASATLASSSMLLLLQLVTKASSGIGNVMVCVLYP